MILWFCVATQTECALTAIAIGGLLNTTVPVTAGPMEGWAQAWAGGMRSKHGMHVHGFPNLFFSQPVQGANLISNVPHNLTEAGKTIGLVVAEARKRGAQEVEVTEESQKAWVDLLLSGPGRMIGMNDCTPGYYNNEGLPAGPEAKYAVGYPGGASAYFKYIDAWRNDGKFDGLEFR